MCRSRDFRKLIGFFEFHTHVNFGLAVDRFILYCQQSNHNPFYVRKIDLFCISLHVYITTIMKIMILLFLDFCYEQNMKDS